MPRSLLGQMPGELRASQFISASQIRGGTITAKELIIAGGTKGVIRSQNFVSGVSGWAAFGDGNAEFNNVTVRGDLVSGNWDGADPANLTSSSDGTATAGYYLDASAGAAQFEGNLYLGGDFLMQTGSTFKTAESGDRIEIGGDDAFISLYDSANGLVGQIGWAASGYGADNLTIENASGLGDIVLDAAGTIELNAAGSGSEAVVVYTDGVGVPANLFEVKSANGSTIYAQFKDTPELKLHSLSGSAADLRIYESADDWHILNDQQDNGIVIYNGSGGTEIWYNGSAVLEVDSNGGLQVVSGDLVVDAGDIKLDTHITLQDTSGHILMNDANAEIEFGGGGGPSGLNFFDEGYLFYRTTPNTLTFEDGAGTEIFGFDVDNGHGWMESPQTTTNSGLAAWRHNSFSGGGPYDFIPLVSSSARHKKYIRDVDIDALAAEVDKVRLREWQERAHIGTAKKGEWIQGVVAEEVAEVAPHRVLHDDEGQPQLVDFPMAFPVPMMAKLKVLDRDKADKEYVRALEDRVAALEEKIAALT